MRLDPIVMAPYDSGWPAAFEREAGRLRTVLGAVLWRDIEHMGSTAVPGLIAKPIVDMVAIVSDIAMVEPLLPALGALGWIHAPEPADVEERRLSCCTPSIARRTHHLHVVEESSDAWLGWLAFRDHLRTHPETAQKYGRLKQRLADAHGSDPNQRDAYRSGKAALVGTVTTEALRLDRA